MMSKRAKRAAAVGLLAFAIAVGLFLNAYLNAIPMGEEYVEAFVGGPNMKEASGERTETEDLLYQHVSNNQKRVKKYFLDVTGDGANELLTFEETKLQSRKAHKISLWGIDADDEVKIMVTWTVMHASNMDRIAIYLHPEEDGSYTIVEDTSCGGRRDDPNELAYRRYRFILSADGYKQDILEQADGLAKENQDEFLRMEELLMESIVLYDTLPSAKLTKSMVE